MNPAALAFLIPAVITLLLVWPLRRVALKFGILDLPGPRKSHRHPIPYLGGLAVLGGATVGILWIQPARWPVVGLMAFVAALGLFDDIRHAPVAGKLMGQYAAAVAAVGLGYVWHITDSTAINVGLSILWIVGLSNSFNLLDNMDGLTCIVAGGSLLTIALIVPVTAPLTLPLAGAVIAFLVVNRPPAGMFMGDAGALMVGFGVALASIQAANTARGLHSLVLLTLPVALALFDTSLVIVSRLRTGRPIQLGGRDHFSHRLQLLGWSRPQILLGAMAISAAGAAIAYLAVGYPRSEAWLALPIGAVYFGLWLGLLRVDPYRAGVDAKPEVYSA
jgi:UDP-GlcNAc:undecaprenyl-phosphate GlcNAc-1-phosphate transferase